MSIVRVTKIGKSRSGKPIAYFDNRHGQTDGYLLGAKCPTPQEGMTIEADTKSWVYQGKTYWGLESWKLVEASPQSRNYLPHPDRGNGQSPPTEAPVGWDIQSGDLSRFVSNVVGSAIAAALIKEPVDLHRWVKSAYEAAESLRNGYQNDAPDPSERHDRDDGDPGFDGRGVPF